MDFISTKEAADKWNISRRRVIRLASEGRIPGAALFGKSWMIPADAVKPADGRTKPVKAGRGEDLFRFPFYMNAPAGRFFPPLSDEECRLRQAQLDILACEFEKAGAEFEALLAGSGSSSIRIASLFFLCNLSVCYSNGECFEEYYSLLNAAVNEDQPHRQDLALLLPFLLGCLALYTNAADKFHFSIEYEYSPSSYPLLTVLSFLKAMIICSSGHIDLPIETAEIDSQHLECVGHYYEAQLMHLLLFFCYHLKADEKASLFHLKKGMDIALTHHYIYPMANAYMYYPDQFSKALKEYPDEFAGQISHFGNLMHLSFADFMSKNKITDLYTELSRSEYQFIFYACEGYSNLNVANILHLSERTVANRYSEIYDKLGIKGKRELVMKTKFSASSGTALIK